MRQTLKLQGQLSKNKINNNFKSFKKSQLKTLKGSGGLNVNKTQTEQQEPKYEKLNAHVNRLISVFEERPMEKVIKRQYNNQSELLNVFKVLLFCAT